MLSQEEIERIESMFKGKDTVASTYTPLYPYSCERELKRIMVDYTNSLINDVKKKIPEMQKVYKRERDANQGKLREDGLMDLQHDLLDELVSISDEAGLGGDLGKYDKMVVRVGRMTSKHVVREWRKSVKKTFKTDSDEGGDIERLLFSAMLSKFGADVRLRMTDMRDKMMNSIMSQLTEAYRRGQNMTEAFRDLGRRMTRWRRRAGMEARDIVGGLNASMQRETGGWFGSDLYIWVTRRDDRVRECHRTLDGRIFRWSNPPEMWYRRRGAIVYTGRYCNPGEDYGCRCVARYVFTWAGIRELLGIRR